MRPSKESKPLRDKYEARRKDDEAAKRALTDEERDKRLQAVRNEASRALPDGYKRAPDDAQIPRSVPTRPPVPSDEDDMPGHPSSSNGGDPTEQASTAKISELEEDLRKEREERARCQDKLRDAESRIETLERDLDEARCELKMATLEDREDEIQKQKRIKAGLVEQLDEAEKDRASLRRQVRESDARTNELEGHICRMEQQNQKAQIERETPAQRQSDAVGDCGRESLPSDRPSSMLSKKGTKEKSKSKTESKKLMVGRRGNQLFMYSVT